MVLIWRTYCAKQSWDACKNVHCANIYTCECSTNQYIKLKETTRQGQIMEFAWLTIWISFLVVKTSQAFFFDQLSPDTDDSGETGQLHDSCSSKISSRHNQPTTTGIKLVLVAGQLYDIMSNSVFPVFRHMPLVCHQLVPCAAENEKMLWYACPHVHNHMYFFLVSYLLHKSELQFCESGSDSEEWTSADLCASFGASAAWRAKWPALVRCALRWTCQKQTKWLFCGVWSDTDLRCLVGIWMLKTLATNYVLWVLSRPITSATSKSPTCTKDCGLIGNACCIWSDKEHSRRNALPSSCRHMQASSSGTVSESKGCKWMIMTLEKSASVCET